MEVVLESVAPTFERLNQFNNMKQAQKDTQTQVKSIKQFNVRAKLNQDYAEKILNLEKAVKLLERMNEKRERLFRTKIKDEASRLNTTGIPPAAPLARGIPRMNSTSNPENFDATPVVAPVVSSRPTLVTQNSLSRSNTPPAVSVQDKRWIRPVATEEEPTTTPQSSPTPAVEVASPSAEPSPPKTVTTPPSVPKHRKSAAEEYLLEQLGAFSREKALSRSNSNETDEPLASVEATLSRSMSQDSPNKSQYLGSDTAHSIAYEKGGSEKLDSAGKIPSNATKEDEKTDDIASTTSDSSVPKRSAAEEYLMQQLGLFKSGKAAPDSPADSSKKVPIDETYLSPSKSKSSDDGFGGTQLMDEGLNNTSFDASIGGSSVGALSPESAEYKSIYDANFMEDPNALIDDSPNRRASFGRQALHAIEEGDEDAEEDSPPKALPSNVAFGRVSSGRGGINVDATEKSLFPDDRRGSFGKSGLIQDGNSRNMEDFGLLSATSTDSVDPTNGLDSISDLTASIDMQDNHSIQSKASDMYSRASDHPPIAGMPPVKKRPRPTMKGLVKRVNSLLAMGRNPNDEESKDSDGKEYTSPTKQSLQDQNVKESAPKDWDDLDLVEADNFSVSSAGESDNKSQTSKPTQPGEKKTSSKSLSFFAKASVSFFSKKKSTKDMSGAEIMAGSDAGTADPEEKKEKKIKTKLSFFSKKKSTTDMSAASDTNDNKSESTETGEKKEKKVKSVLSFFSKKKSKTDFSAADAAASVTEKSDK